MDDCAGIVRWRDRQNHAFTSLPRNSAERRVYDLQNGLNHERDLLCRGARRADLTRRTFRAADQAQPQAAGFQYGSHVIGKARALLGVVEDMKATAVEDEMEPAAGWGRGEKVQCREAAT